MLEFPDICQGISGYLNIMRFQRPMDELFASSSRMKVLRVLCRFLSRESTGREVARLSGSSVPQAIGALKDLERAGIAHMHRAGRAFLWRLEVEHVLVPVVREVFRKEDSLREDLLETLRAGLLSPKILRAVVYGSIAQGRESSRSDIDLLIEVTRERDKEKIQPDLEKLGSKVFLRYGNPLSTLTYTRDEVRSPRNQALLRNLQIEGWIVK